MRYGRKCSHPQMMAKASFSRVSHFNSPGLSVRLAYAIGYSLPSKDWESTTPRPRSDASVWSLKVLVKSGEWRIGSVVSAVLSFAKPSWHSASQSNDAFFSRSL